MKIPDQKAISYFDLLVEISKNNQKNQQKANDLNELLTLVLKVLTSSEIQSFSNNFSRCEFIIDVYKTPQDITQIIRYFDVIRRKNKLKESFQNLDVQNIIWSLSVLINYFSKITIPNSLEKYSNVIQRISYKAKGDTIKDVFLFVLEVSEEKRTQQGKPYFTLSGNHQDYGKLSINLWEEFYYLKKLVWQYSTVYFSLIEENRTYQSYATNSVTHISLDPDFLVDVTGITQCIFERNNGFKAAPFQYFISKHNAILPNSNMFRGTLVNNYLDEYLSGREISAYEIFDDAISLRPFNALMFDEDSRKSLIFELDSHLNNIKNGPVNNLRNKKMILEPTFLSEQFGLKGRLDILVDEDRKDVIELKTSKDPRGYGFGDTWIKDQFQAICYNLMVKLLNNGEVGSSSILYSRVSPSNDPLRNVPNTNRERQYALKIRNHIVGYEHRLIDNPLQVLSKIIPDKFPMKLMWDNQQLLIEEFQRSFNSLTSTEKKYFLSFSSFIAKEYRTAKLGNESEKGNSGFASLWHLSEAEKQKKYRILSSLKFESIDNGTKVATFTIEEKIDNSFRQGDFILLYPQEPSKDLQPTKHQILKATIKKLTDKELVLNIFNPNIDENYFLPHSHWVIEPELFEYSYDCMRQSLLNFAKSNSDKKNLLLGITPPKFSNNPIISGEDLKPNQNKILNKALNAKDYFLIQGPPGTGKTKYMLKELVIQLLKNPNEKILLLAYTNKAVDEICEAVKSIRPNPEFYRLGNRETTIHPEILLSAKIENKSLSEIKAYLLSTRVLISTVLSYQRKPQINKHLNFTTAIVDETSQLLDPQLIGTLCQVNRFILIGDEKQLPPVVIQNEDGLYTQDEALNGLGIRNLGASIFERLLKLCQENKWEDAFGSLVDQGRMHESIQQFPSENYYDNTLQTILPHQTEILPEYLRNNINSKIFKWFADKRLVFIDSTRENRRNINIEEAKMAVTVARQFRLAMGKEFNKTSIGIIAPYRAQVAEIKRQLYSSVGKDLADEITVDTVERYQGGQRKVIIYTFAVNYQYQLNNLHNLNEDKTVDRKLNVIITRAKEHLILIGCKDILMNSKYFADIIHHYSRNGKMMVMKKKSTKTSYV